MLARQFLLDLNRPTLDCATAQSFFEEKDLGDYSGLKSHESVRNATSRSLAQQKFKAVLLQF